KHAAVMHPLPRLDEITVDVDDDPSLVWGVARGVQFSTGRAIGMGRAVGTIMQFGTSLSSLAQSFIISLWFDPVDCHDYPSRGYHDLYTIQRSVQRYVQVDVDRRLSISEEALGAFGGSQPTEDRYRVEGTTEGRKQNINNSKSSSRDKELNMTAGDTDDALVCCVENTVDDRIMDSGASFLATYCKEELKRFKLRSSKVCLADDKTPDIAGIGDVVLKTSFGTSWTLKDVRYILGLKKRLIFVGQLDEEGYHVGFGDQQWKRLGDMSRIGMSMLASKGNVPDVWKVDIYFCKPGGLGKQKKLSSIMSEKTRKLQSRSCGRYNANLQFGVAERLSRTFRAESTRLRAEAPKMLWADSITAQMKCDTTFGIQRVTRLSEAEILHLWTRFIELENDSIVAEHGLSSEITQSLCGSSDTSEGSKNSRSFEDSGRLDEEYSEDGASSKEGASETPQVRRYTRESRAPVKYSPSANYLLLTENYELESYSKALSSKESVQWKKSIIEEMFSLEKNHTCSLVRLPAGKKHHKACGCSGLKDINKRYKARLVVKGFQQKRGVEYNEIFSLVMKMTTIRLVLSIVASEDLHLEKLDVKTTFLHSDLDEDIYMTQPMGFQSAGKEENLVCKLKKSLYGLKQAPRQWYLKFESFRQRAGYKRCAMDHCSDMAEFNKPKWLFPLVFEMKDRCSKKQVLGYVLTVDTKSSINLVKNLKFCSWTKVVWILISEGSLSLLKILGTKSLAAMFTRLVMKEKLKFCAASTGLRDTLYRSLLALRLVGAACSVCSAIQKGKADHAVQIEWDRWSGNSRTLSCIVVRKAYCSTGFERRIVSLARGVARGVQFSMGHAVGTGRAVWHEPEQFSSDLYNISLV
ncbi:retrovirus-related pol polyprotein from transposon TNT 1-94, partial [Tanacetum coccineum]